MHCHLYLYVVHLSSVSGNNCAKVTAILVYYYIWGSKKLWPLSSRCIWTFQIHALIVIKMITSWINKTLLFLHVMWFINLNVWLIPFVDSDGEHEDWPDEEWESLHLCLPWLVLQTIRVNQISTKSSFWWYFEVIYIYLWKLSIWYVLQITIHKLRFHYSHY